MKKKIILFIIMFMSLFWISLQSFVYAADDEMQQLLNSVLNDNWWTNETNVSDGSQKSNSVVIGDWWKDWSVVIERNWDTNFNDDWVIDVQTYSNIQYESVNNIDKARKILN